MFTQENDGERFANKSKPSYPDTNRFVFYQAGKCLVETLLLNHPKISLLKVTELKNNVVSSIQGLPPIETRTNLEILLIGFYAGKAGELFTSYIQTDLNQHRSLLKYEHKAGITRSRCACLPAKQLSDTKIEQFLRQSDSGLFDRVKATFLAQSLTVNGSIHSQNIFNLQKNSIVGNLNNTEIKDKKVSYLFQSLEEDLKNGYLQGNNQNRFNKVLTNLSKKKESATKPKSIRESSSIGTFQLNDLLKSKKTHFISQNKEISSCCEEIVCKALTFSIKPYGHWFRIYLPQIQTHQRQPRSSDQFFKKRRELGFGVRELRSVGKQSSTKPLFFYANKVKKRATITYKINRAKLYQKGCLGNKSNIFALTSLPRSTECCCACLFAKTLFLQDTILTPMSASLWPQEMGYGVCHGLVLNTFSRAFNLLSRNRELLDILTDHFIRFGKIRAPEILRICSFYVDTVNTFTSSADQKNRGTLLTRARGFAKP